MSPSQYEEYVEELVRQLEFGSELLVERNARLPGVRQPGEYEIDVAVRVQLAGKISFLMIVECKNWSRPVDRPVVQKTVQTRDAVAAHKAAIASPVGFSEEAIEVAQANGVALWVISRTQWSIVMGLTGPGLEARIPYRQRVDFLSKLGFVASPSSRERRDLALIDWAAAHAGNAGGAWNNGFFHYSSGGSALTPGDNEPGVDPRLAMCQLADEYAHMIGVPVVPGCRSRGSKTEMGLFLRSDG